MTLVKSTDALGTIYRHLLASLGARTLNLGDFVFLYTGPLPIGQRPKERMDEGDTQKKKKKKKWVGMCLALD